MNPLTGVTAVDDMISRLALQPHPEGGFYRETFRGGVAVEPVDGRGTRDGGTAILYLLPSGARSRLHRVISDEVWAFQGGDPVRLRWWTASGEPAGDVTLGHGAGDVPQATVPAGCWQDAAPAIPAGGAGWSLCGCVVVPGFDFADFTLIDGVLDALVRVHLARAVAWLAGDDAAATEAIAGLSHADDLAMMVLESEGIIERVDGAHGGAADDGVDDDEEADLAVFSAAAAADGNADDDHEGDDDHEDDDADLSDLDDRVIMLAELMFIAEQVHTTGSAAVPADDADIFRAALEASPLDESAMRRVLGPLR